MEKGWEVFNLLLCFDGRWLSGDKVPDTRLTSEESFSCCTPLSDSDSAKLPHLPPVFI